MSRMMLWIQYITDQFAPQTTCVICHAPPVSNILSGHYEQTVRTADNNMTPGETIVCASCHDANSTNHTGGIALGDGSNIVWGKVRLLLFRHHLRYLP